MKPKDFLLQYRRALERARQIDKRLESLYQETIRATAPKAVAVRTSRKNADPAGDLAVKIAETTEKLETQRFEALQLAEQIFAVIDQVKDTTQARLLFDRYIAGMSWDKTASDLGYDPVHTRGRLHGTALESVRKILENEDATKYYKDM